MKRVPFWTKLLAYVAGVPLAVMTLFWNVSIAKPTRPGRGSQQKPAGRHDGRKEDKAHKRRRREVEAGGESRESACMVMERTSRTKGKALRVAAAAGLIHASLMHLIEE